MRRAFIGVAGETAPLPRRFALAAGIANTTGAMLTSVNQSGPAAAGGLMRDDLIVRLDGEPVTGVDDLIRLLNADRIDRKVEIDVIRLGRLRHFAVTPSERKNVKPRS